jgi:excinuclease ABC subunit C
LIAQRIARGDLSFAGPRVAEAPRQRRRLPLISIDMAIPSHVVIKHGQLPPEPGVYFMKTADGGLLYIGKATSLRTRVSSYFSRPQEPRIASMVGKIGRIDYEVTPTAIEALMLESRLIKKHQPPYNVMEKDDKSWVYLVITDEAFPRPLLVRERDLERDGRGRYGKVFGPFTSAATVRAALTALRPAFPWTHCRPDAKRACFYRPLGLCPGVCVGEISPRDYRRIIRGLARFFEGRRGAVTAELEREMRAAATAEKFEEAAALRNRLRALAAVRDFSVLRREAEVAGLAAGRIEGYDVAHLGGDAAVASMVVFEAGEPSKSEYRTFHIKAAEGGDDYGSMAEALTRRFRHIPGGEGAAWPMPDLLLIDGGRGQVRIAEQVVAEAGLNIPVVGLAKGPDRKRDAPVYRRDAPGLAELVAGNLNLLKRVRDEAHRFAGAGHRKRRRY